MKGKVKGDPGWWTVTIFTVGLCLVFLTNVILRLINNDVACLDICFFNKKSI